MSDMQKNPGHLSELFGAVADSFTRNRSARLTRLEDRLVWLRHWTIIGAVMMFAYFGYQLWGELRQELGTYHAATERVDDVVTDDAAADDARTSIFLIFAAALGGPIVLIIGYIVLGFIYNVCHEALVRRIPLSRFMVVPVLLIMGLMFLESRRDELKGHLLQGYDAVERRIASAKSLQQQARAAGEKVREMRQMEAQLQALSDGRQMDDTLHSTQERVPGSGTSDANGATIGQDEAVRRLGEMMLQLQGLPLPPQQQQENGQAATEQTATPDQNVPPAVEGRPVASPAAPAGI